MDPQDHIAAENDALRQTNETLRKQVRELADHIIAAQDIVLQAPHTPISNEVLRALGYGGA